MKEDELVLKTIQTSEHNTLEKLLRQIRKVEKLHNDAKTRLWKNSK